MTDLTGAPSSALPAVDRRGLLARLRSDRFFLVGTVIVALSLFLAAFGPLISPYDPLRSTGEISAPPPHSRPTARPTTRSAPTIPIWIASIRASARSSSPSSGHSIRRTS